MCDLLGNLYSGRVDLWFCAQSKTAKVLSGRFETNFLVTCVDNTIRESRVDLVIEPV